MSKKPKRIVSVTAAVVVGLLAAGATTVLGWIVQSADAAPTRVVFVVPAHYRGVLKLEVTHDIHRTIQPTHGAYRFTFPADGVLKIDSRLPVWNFRHLTVQTTGGNVIPDADETKVSPDAIAFYYMGAASPDDNVGSKEAYYLIGTKREFTNSLIHLFGHHQTSGGQ